MRTLYAKVPTNRDNNNELTVQRAVTTITKRPQHQNSIAESNTPEKLAELVSTGRRTTAATEAARVDAADG